MRTSRVSMSLLEIKSVAKRFGPHEELNGLTLNV